MYCVIWNIMEQPHFDYEPGATLEKYKMRITFRHVSLQQQAPNKETFFIQCLT